MPCAPFSPEAVAPRFDKHMLKILKQTENAQLTKVNLHGRFTSEYVAEVEKALAEDGRSKVTLDLSNVTRKGIRLSYPQITQIVLVESV